MLNNNNYLLDNDDILSLKNIYYQNYYKYKYFNIPNIIKNNTKSNQYILKNIWNNFNIYISSEDLYGVFDNYIDYISNFLNIYYNDIEDNCIKINNELDTKLGSKMDNNLYNKLDIDLVDGTDNNENYYYKIKKDYKKILQLINNYSKIKLVYNIDEINYDICSNCKNKMIIQSNTSELLCINCGNIYTLIGSVFEDSQFYNQEGNRYRHGTYDPSRHCKFWIDRIQAKENTIIEDNIINKIKECIKRDRIENIKNISIKQFRIYLKQANLSKLNDHIPLIKKMITGYIPPQLTHNELHILFNYFDKATKTYDIIKPKEKSNSLYYPFLIYKILDLIIIDEYKKKELLSCIHLQSYETLIDNDKIWKHICKYNENFIYKPTEKIV
jgi:hypothetical protein